jgi:hypothetical protein
MFKTITGRVALILTIIMITASAFSRDLSYKIITIDDVSRYDEDRIAYQQIENIIDPEEHQTQDTSIGALLIIRDKKMYLFKDGYDDPKIVEQNRVIREMESRLIMNTLWEREIDGKPDYVRITDRRQEIQRKEISFGAQENLDERYANFYAKTRDSFIKRHTEIFKGLLVNRKDSELKVERRPIPKPLNYNGPTKYFISVVGKTKNGMIYYAQDADGDGITETFTVNLPDGFHWGYKSGPNIIFIYKNKQENIKELIGNFTKFAIEGTPEEDKIIQKQFDQLDVEIPELMDDLIQMDLETKRVLDQAKE